MRGSLRCKQPVSQFTRSIPASAGQPQEACPNFVADWVYPRECGAARRQHLRVRRSWGLSPRVRGSQYPHNPAIQWCGSIPASAGQPTPSSRTPPPATVYPRECGAAGLWALNRDTQMGLSPRVRGSHRYESFAKSFQRSIPASAGQPFSRGQAKSKRQVYPRECGAAPLSRRTTFSRRGLSPRVRGSPVPVQRGCGLRRSIPASAGQPVLLLLTPLSVEVYPRECGAAVVEAKRNQIATGLSPRVRGSRLFLADKSRELRSIPASAGQPRRLGAILGVARVYPRECGAAFFRDAVSCHYYGLSPRVRGSRA